VHTDEAAAAWHGLGIAAAQQQRSAEAEEALARAVQLDPVNVDYLGDLGYQRLRVGAVTSAHEPLAKAAELAPGNLKAVSNLVLWMLLDNDYAQADAAMQQANLPDAARQQVRSLAMQLRIPPQSARPRVIAALSVHAPAAAAGGAAASRPSSAEAGDGVPPSMLERFGTSSTNSEAHP
jgi:Flp pilus assembly protein TadD